MPVNARRQLLIKRLRHHRRSGWPSYNRATELRLQWGSLHRDRDRATHKRYRERHPELVSQRKKSWEANNRERVNATHKAWYLANRDRILVDRRAKYAVKHGQV